MNEVKLFTNPVTSGKNSKHLSEETSLKAHIISDNPNRQIFGIDSCMFDDTSYLPAEDNSMPLYTSINYDQTLIKTYSVELTTSNRPAKPRLLYQLESSQIKRDSSSSSTVTTTPVFKSHALSKLIEGETCVLVDDELYLMTAERGGSRKPERLARDLAPKHAGAPPWTQSVRFSDYTQPRAFLYTDSTQYLTLDCRIRNQSDRKDLWTFDLQRSSLAPNETILQTSWLLYYYFLII